MHQADMVGWTPLHIASHRLGEDRSNTCQCKRCLNLHKRRRKCVALLLQDGAPPNAADHHGATPAHLAASHDDVEGLQILRDHGADLTAEDGSGRTPLSLARQLYGEASDVVKLLLMPQGAAAAPDAALAGAAVVGTAAFDEVVGAATSSPGLPPKRRTPPKSRTAMQQQQQVDPDDDDDDDDGASTGTEDEQE